MLMYNMVGKSHQSEELTPLILHGPRQEIEVCYSSNNVSELRFGNVIV